MPSYYAAILADGPVAWWRLDETTGSSVAADQLRLEPGAYIGVVTLDSPGLLVGDLDTAVGFDGSTGYVQVPYNAALYPAAFSLEALVNPTALTGQSGVCGSQTGNTGAWIFGINDQIKAQVGTGSSVTTLAAPHGSLGAGGTTQAVLTYDGTTAKLYINGASAAVATTAYTPVAGKAFFIGTFSAVADYFSGVIDEVAVYNYALTAAQVATHYAAASSLVASNITATTLASVPTTATLSADVNPQGLDAQVYFQWWTTAAYGSTTPPQDIGPGFSAVPVTAVLSPLVPDVTYHYQVVVVDSAGTTYA